MTLNLHTSPLASIALPLPCPRPRQSLRLALSTRYPGVVALFRPFPGLLALSVSGPWRGDAPSTWSWLTYRVGASGWDGTDTDGISRL